MKMNNFELVNMLRLLHEFEDKKLPQKIGYGISRNIINCEKEYQTYEQRLNKLNEKYSDDIQKDKNGEYRIDENGSLKGVPVFNSTEKREDYLEELSELLNIEVEVELYAISEDVFAYDDSKGYDVLSPKEILILQSILCKDKTETDS